MSPVAIPKAGGRVNLFVGTSKEPYVAVEGASVNILTRHSGFAKEKVGPGVTHLYIPNSTKEVVSWMYRYMLAGEKGPDNLKTGEFRFEDMPIGHLVTLYNHCMTLQYSALADKSVNRLRYLISKERVLPTHVFEAIFKTIPALRELVVQPIVTDIVNSVLVSDFNHLENALKVPGLTQVLEEAVGKRLEWLINRSHQYYALPHMQRRVEKQNSQISSSSNGKGKPTCYNCGLTGHIARHCTTKSNNNGPRKSSNADKIVDAINDTVNKAPRTGPTCYQCKKVGHIARNCTAQPATNGTVTENSGTALKESSKNIHRTGPTCYNCNQTGHIARYCEASSGDDFKENKPRNKASHRRAHYKKYIEVVTNGEGLRTCDHEVKPGQYTRLGLRI